MPGFPDAAGGTHWSDRVLVLVARETGLRIAGRPTTLPVVTLVGCPVFHREEISLPLKELIE